MAQPQEIFMENHGSFKNIQTRHALTSVVAYAHENGKAANNK
jgi:hypothetical protein